MRGLATAGRRYGAEQTACLVSSVAPRRGVLLIVPSRVAPGAATASVADEPDCGGLVVHWSAITARDQHQPASSRAMATLASTGFFSRASKRAHRWCRRWLAASPRATAAAGASAQRLARVRLGR